MYILFEKWVTCMASLWKLHHISGCERAYKKHNQLLNTREEKAQKSGHKSSGFFCSCWHKWGCHNVMQRYEKCEVDDPFSLSETFCDSMLLPCTKFHLNPGSTLNPDDGEEGDDVNFECKTQATRKHSIGRLNYGFSRISRDPRDTENFYADNCCRMLSEAFNL